jgi:hypothetical protein
MEVYVYLSLYLSLYIYEGGSNLTPTWNLMMRAAHSNPRRSKSPQPAAEFCRRSPGVAHRYAWRRSAWRAAIRALTKGGSEALGTATLVRLLVRSFGV